MPSSCTKFKFRSSWSVIIFYFIKLFHVLEPNQLVHHLRIHLFPSDETELVINDSGKFQLLMSAFASEKLTKVSQGDYNDF